MHRNLRSSLLAATAALALAACGGDGGSTDSAGADSNGGSGAETVTVVATEFAFDPEGISVPADTPVDLVLENDGVVEHDITVDELGLKVEADGAATTTETVTLAAGTYEVYCSVPGHRESGMVATLTVS